MELQEALDLIETLKTQVAGLTQEKTALLGKRDELLEKVVKYKAFEGVDVPGLLRTKEMFETQGDNLKQQERALELRLSTLEEDRKKELTARELEKRQLIADRTKALTVTELSKPAYGVYNANQLYQIVGDRASLDESGTPTIGGVDIPTFVKNLRTNPEYQNQFRASGVTGSGSHPNTGGLGASGVNPWKAGVTFNLTEQTKIFRENPTLARSLMAAAKG